MSGRCRLAAAVASPVEARSALEAGADYVLAPARRERPQFGIPDRLRDGGEVDLLFAVAGDETMPAEPLRVARIRSAGDLAVLRGGDYAAAFLDPERALLRAVSLETVAQFARACREARLECWLGGSLELPDIPRLLVVRPDALVFERLDPDGLAAARRMLHADRRFDPAAPTDRIVMRNFVLPLIVGAYDFERDRPQRVRFSVDADVRRAPINARGVGDIYSYDLVMDAVRRLTERGHTDLVETLAEDLAADLLGDGRVARVMVRVEKLDLGPESVGIEIRRDRNETLID